MEAEELALMMARANSAISKPPGRLFHQDEGAARFVLYHSALSLGSQMVRMALAEKEAGCHAYDMAILPPAMECYLPDYVRLRLAGIGQAKLAERYAGGGSAGIDGHDACTVPTLIDSQAKRVIADSQAILLHIDQYVAGAPLMPTRHRQDILRQMEIVVRMPHQALFEGALSDGDHRPRFLQEQSLGIHDYKIMRLMEARSLAIGDPDLVAAYDAKIKKEAAGRIFVRSPEQMRGALREVEQRIKSLEKDLEHDQDWLIKERFTMADLAWAVMLFRLQWLGMACLWTGEAGRGSRLPRVMAYAKRLFQRPSFRLAVREWPGVWQAEPGRNEEVSTGASLPAGNGGPPGSLRSTRDIREDCLTGAVLSTLDATPDLRSKQLFRALARHLHAFIEEVEPTEAEWQTAIDFLTRTGKLSSDRRQEFILLSDVLGATARVDLINHRFPAGATENSVLGPFYLERRPICANGDDISGGQRGEPMAFCGRVLDTAGQPVAGACVDIWHSDGIGAYDVMIQDLKEAAMRGMFRADAQGRFWFISILPTSYPIPMDGTVGELMRATGRSPVRPAHVHVRIEAPGYRLLTTMLFVADDPYLDSDPVFGVKSSLIVPFAKASQRRMPDGAAIPEGSHLVEHDFVLAKRP